MIEALWIMMVIGASCSLMGNLLVLKQNVMVADAISHTILLGIVLAFFIVPDLDSPFLQVGATLFGVVTVLSIEALAKTKRLQHDAAIGLVFPAFFSIAVLLISRYFKNVHLDIDMVLLGEIVFAPLNRMDILGISLPKAFVQGIVLFIVNVAFIIAYYGRLKLRLFDETLARTIGIYVGLLDVLMMTLVSLTSVLSFQSVGAILVLSLMIAPALTAKCLATSFPQLLVLGVFISMVNCTLGYISATYFNVSLSGMVAVVSILTFLLVFIAKRRLTRHA
ncbi:MAG: metal ABC transporter permease [Aerococcaceae bacterium]|nr:metal ABC transporter permease [Aerococcaceae bacterium]